MADDRINYGFCGLYFDLNNINKVLDIIPDKMVYDKEGYGKENETHITILYGFLDNVTASDVFKYFKDIDKIPFTIEGLSLFENDEFDVLKFDVKSELLNELNAKLRKLPCEITYPDYIPHITLAYLNKDKNNKKFIKKLNKPKVLYGNRIKFADKDKNSKYLKLS